jgi:hypothetical protein
MAFIEGAGGETCGLPPLTQVLVARAYDCVEFSIRSGTKVNASRDRPPFIIVCANARSDARLEAASRVTMAQLVLNSGLRPLEPGSQPPIYARVMSGHPMIVAALIKTDADLTMRARLEFDDCEEEFTSVVHACAAEHSPMT